MGPLADNFFNRQVLAQYGPSILGGFWLTVEVELLTIVVGVATGLALAIAAFAVGAGSTVGIVLIVLAAILLVTAAVGFCPLYRLFGLRTNKEAVSATTPR